MLRHHVHWFRPIFLCFMTWLLVAFLPAHTRGRITLGPTASEDTCCEPAPVVAPQADGCCASKADASATSSKPSSSQRANCAVCFWAAGLLTVVPVTFDHALAERAFETARHYDAQVRREAMQLTHHGRDPPTMLG